MASTMYASICALHMKCDRERANAKRTYKQNEPKELNKNGHVFFFGLVIAYAICAHARLRALNFVRRKRGRVRSKCTRFINPQYERIPKRTSIIN